MRHLGTRPLKTERLILLKDVMSDAKDMFVNWVTDPEATRFWGREPHKDISVTKALLRQWFAEYKQENCCHSVIMNKENQRGGPLLAEQGVLEPWHYERVLQKGGSICL